MWLIGFHSWASILKINTCILRNTLCLFHGFKNGANLVHMCRNHQESIPTEIFWLHSIFAPASNCVVQSLPLECWSLPITLLQTAHFRQCHLQLQTTSFEGLILSNIFDHRSFNFLHPMASKPSHGVIFL